MERKKTVGRREKNFPHFWSRSILYRRALSLLSLCITSHPRGGFYPVKRKRKKKRYGGTCGKIPPTHCPNLFLKKSGSTSHDPLFYLCVVSDRQKDDQKILKYKIVFFPHPLHSFFVINEADSPTTIIWAKILFAYGYHHDGRRWASVFFPPLPPRSWPISLTFSINLDSFWRCSCSSLCYSFIFPVIRNRQKRRGEPQKMSLRRPYKERAARYTLKTAHTHTQ